MSTPRVILRWQDTNNIEIGHKIYRSDTPMDIQNMPTPIATLNPNTTEYTDEAVIEGNFYYYRVSAYTTNGEEYSNEVYAEAIIAIGPGPSTLIAGDMTAGFFGEVPTSELITGDDLATAIGLTAGTSQFSNEPWLKFALDDNIIYVAKKPYRHTVSWENIYQAGAVYGTGDNGLYPSGGDRLQDAKITVDGFSLDVTLLRGTNTDPAIYTSNGYDMDYTHTSEWNRLMYPIHSGIHTDSSNPSSPSVPYAQWATYSDEDLLLHQNLGNGSYSWVQETQNTDTARHFFRGDYGVTRVGSHTATYAVSGFGWRPALRLGV